MICSNCGLSLTDPGAQTCPRCGQPVASSASENVAGRDVPTDAISESPPPPFSVPMPSGADGFGENFGFALPGQSASSGYAPMPPSGGIAPTPSVPTPPRKSKSGLIIGILLVLVVVLAGGLGVSLYALNRHDQPQGQASLSPNTAPTPSPTSTPNETILFQDPLTSNTNGWANDSHCFFQNNSYHIKDNYVCYTPIDNVVDETISVQVKQVAGSVLYPYGIVFRRESPGNWYEFDIDSNGKWVFFKAVNRTPTRLVNYTANAAIKRGLNTTNTLMVQFKGSLFTFFINGTQVGTAQDTTLSFGGSGLEAGLGVEAAFNNLLITTVS